MTATYLWEIFVNLIENTIIAFLLFHRLTLRNSKHYIGTLIGFVCAMCILVSFFNLYQISTTATQLVLFLSRMAFISLFFRNTLSEKTFACCLPSFMSIFADQITYTIALVFSASNPTSFDFLGGHRILSTLLYLFFMFIFMLVFLRVFNDISALPEKLFIFFVITTVIALFVSTFFLNIIVEIDTDLLPMNYRIQLNSISIFILLVFLAMLFLVQITSTTFQENIKLAEQLHRHEKTEERNKAVLQSTKNLHKWKHDYANHLAVIDELIETKSYDRLRQYVNHQRESLPQTFPIINTEHPIVDAILTGKYAVARSEHISFAHTVVLPRHFPVSDIEITGILGNLLDNSIEACKNIIQQQETPNLYIQVILKTQRNMLHIRVKNSSSGNYRYNSDGQLQTTKSPPALHGNGLANVKEIAEANSGFCNITAGTNCFTVDVYIPLSPEIVAPS